MSPPRLLRRCAVRLAASDPLEEVVLGVPPLRALAYRRAKRYVAGVDIADALDTATALGREGVLSSIDLFGENVSDIAYAEAETARYLALAEAIAAHPGTYVSLDCSHLGLSHDPMGCRQRVERIAQTLPAGARLQLGAEESGRADAILDMAYGAASRGLSIMVTVQANLRRSAADVERLAQAQIPIRLVKGAYAEPSHVAHPWGAETDRAYIELAERLETLSAEHSLATHDPAILTRLLADRHHAAIEFLFGVREDEARHLARQGHQMRVYVPYGPRWFRYYARRLAESIGA